MAQWGDLAVVGRCCKGTLHYKMEVLWDEKSRETLLSDITGGDIDLKNGIIAREDATDRHYRGKYCAMRWQQFGGDIVGRWCRDRYCTIR